MFCKDVTVETCTEYFSKESKQYKTDESTDREHEYLKKLDKCKGQIKEVSLKCLEKQFVIIKYRCTSIAPFEKHYIY